ncbi:MAG: hypothetical protein IPM46_12435 [Flavobacteriales bacterium]|nr:hypothetical protein [Flavobacteriales bacterium]
MDRLRLALLLALIIAFARYVAVVFFIHPFGDDFSYAVAGMHTELLPRLWDEYQLWNGRWASNPLVLRGPLVLGLEQGLWVYRLVPIALLALTWAGGHAMIRSFTTGLSRMDAFIGASLLLLISIHLMPDPGEGIYWYTGAISYLLPSALTWFVLSIWVKAWREGWRISRRRVLLVALLSTFIAGCNELHMVFMVLLHAALIAWRWRQARALDCGLLFVMGAVAVAATVMLLAPGNAGRAGQFPMRHDLLRTLGWGGVQTGRFLATWLLSPVLLLSSVLFLAGWDWIKLHASWSGDARLPSPLPFAIAIVTLIFIAMALPYWATGLLGQHRTVNATLFLFLPLWFILLASVRTSWRFAWPPLSARFGSVAWALLFTGVLFTGGGGRVTSDLLSGRLTAFNQQVTARYSMITVARDRGDARVALPALLDTPWTVHYFDAGADPAGWVNRSIAYYFQADTMEVVVEP